MRLFNCEHCGQMLYFENTRCERCGHALGFLAEDGQALHAIEPADEAGVWRALGVEGRTFRLCANAAHDVCNWLVDSRSGEAMCAACRHNKVIPELSGADNRLAWRKIERAKHQLFYTLFRLGLAQTTELGAGPEPLVFLFLADCPNVQGQKVMTGHEDGVITIALAEADDAEREQRRKMMGEPYRTLLGHFRHEVGHFFWDRLVRDGGKLAGSRAVFGDDEQDYQEALQRHYENGAPVDWQDHFVSTYATSHAWEDFAETWAHYLHIVDTLEMAQAYDLRLAPSADHGDEFAVAYGIDPYTTPDVHDLIKVWLPVSTALNSLSRTMGKDELYPFILSQPVIEKLAFVHELVRGAVASARAAHAA